MMAKAIETIKPEAGKEACMEIWLPWVEEEAWNSLINQWWRNNSHQVAII
jgi:hypothetical protein